MGSVEKKVRKQNLKKIKKWNQLHEKLCIDSNRGEMASMWGVNGNPYEKNVQAESKRKPDAEMDNEKERC